MSMGSTFLSFLSCHSERDNVERLSITKMQSHKHSSIDLILFVGSMSPNLIVQLDPCHSLSLSVEHASIRD